MNARLTLITFAAALEIHSASAASFQGLGFLNLTASEPFSNAYAVSADGQFVVGVSRSPSGIEAFRWSQSTGMTGLGDLPGGRFFSFARGVSADGLTIVGDSSSARSSETSEQPTEAFRWTLADGMVGLGDLGGNGVLSVAYGVSADGSVVVGQAQSGSPSGLQAFRWTTSDGMTGLGDFAGGSFFSASSAVSEDGSIVVGFGETDLGTQAFRWSLETGLVGLSDLVGGTFSSGASGVSADGSIVVGYGNSASGYAAFRWTSATGMVPLDTSTETTQQFANSVSADGSVIVGYGFTPTGAAAALIWDSPHGVRKLQDVLQTDFGLSDVSSWQQLSNANAISADGNTIVGHGIDAEGRVQAFVANIPEPTAAVLFLSGTLLALRRPKGPRKTLRGAGGRGAMGSVAGPAAQTRGMTGVVWNTGTGVCGITARG